MKYKKIIIMIFFPLKTLRERIIARSNHFISEMLTHMQGTSKKRIAKQGGPIEMNQTLAH